jgi:hypothetical protein
MLLLKATSGKSRWGDPFYLAIGCLRGGMSLHVSWDMFISTEDVPVTTRIDKEPAQTQTWAIGTTYDTTFYHGDVISLVNRLTRANTFLVKVSPYSELPVTATFGLIGLSEAIKPLQQACPSGAWEVAETMPTPEPPATPEPTSTPMLSPAPTPTRTPVPVRPTPTIVEVFEGQETQVIYDETGKQYKTIRTEEFEVPRPWKVRWSYFGEEIFVLRVIASNGSREWLITEMDHQGSGVRWEQLPPGSFYFEITVLGKWRVQVEA